MGRAVLTQHHARHRNLCLRQLGSRDEQAVAGGLGTPEQILDCYADILFIEGLVRQTNLLGLIIPA